MKRNISIMTAFVFLAIFCSGSASPGSASDPLISLSYLGGTFNADIKAEFSAQIAESSAPVVNGAISKIGDIPVSYDGYDYAKSYLAISLYDGQTVTLPQGAAVILSKGTAVATLESGAFINLASGELILSGTALNLNERCISAENTIVTVTAKSNSLAFVDGYYSTTGIVTRNASVFKDINLSDWFYHAVSFVYTNGLFNGTSDDTFSPNLPMTRAMFVTVLHRLDGSHSVTTGKMDFSDVTDPGEYYYNAVAWAAECGVVTGYDDGTFLPNATITREQMAVIMHRYAGISGHYTTASGDLTQFPDSSHVSDYARDALIWAVGKQIINGSDGYLLPQDTATRAQVAQIIFNYSEKA